MILYSRFKRDSIVWVINPYKVKNESSILTPKKYRMLPPVFQASVSDITKSVKLDSAGRQATDERLDVCVSGKNINCIDTAYVYKTEAHAQKVYEILRSSLEQNEKQKRCKIVQYEELNENKSLDTAFITQDYELGDEIDGRKIIEVVCNCYVTFYITLKDGVKLLHRFHSSERRN